MTQNSPTEELARFASGLTYSQLPNEVIEYGKLIILDTVGCGIYGSKVPWGRMIADYVRDMGGNKKATVWGSKFKTTAPNAALANGTMVHGFELDDFHWGLHGGSVIITAALATAEEQGGINGKQFITAIVAGYEVGTRIAACMNVAGHLLRGFHPVGTVGAFAAAIAAGKILNLDEKKTVHCLGIGGTQGAGLMAAQYSAMVKRMHAGRAAQSGVYAAHLAQRGFTGITNVLESEYGGFCSSETLRPPDLTILTKGIEEKEFWTLDVTFKPYSCCLTCHTSIDAVGSVLTENKITPDRIEKITVHCTLKTKEHVGWKYEPESITGAQMNLSYCIAMQVLEGEVFVNQFTERKIKDPNVLNFIRERIEVINDPELEKLGREERNTVIMEVRTTSGEVFTKRLSHAKGSHAKPLSREEVTRKFEYLTRTVLGPEKTKDLYKTIMSIEKLNDVKGLSKLLKT
ncbi:MAG: MmgE/PrpD family protein [Thermodesulfobacteriota bacterium]